MRCRIQLCGRLRVEVDETRVDDELGGRQGQLLLAYLVLNRFREVPRAEILDALWPNGPQPAERALSTLLSKVRRALGGHLEGKAELRLALPPETWIDLEVAEEELHRAEAALGMEAWARAYSSAHVALYIAERGFLSGCELEWAREVRRRVEGVRVQGLECAAAAGLGIGGSELPVAEKNARRAAELAPFRESAHRVLMEALSARGNEAEALRVYADLEMRLRAELETTPGPALEALAKRLARVEEPAFAGGPATRTFVFTDVVSSTDLLEVIGDEAWHDLRAWHDHALRALFAEHGGEEVDHTGDGFFVAFPDAESAVRCAIAIQRRLRDHRREHGFAPHVRIGLHTAQAVRTAGNYTGKGVHEAARIAGVGGAGEIVASRRTVDGAESTASISEPCLVELKGIREAVEIVTIDWR